VKVSKHKAAAPFRIGTGLAALPPVPIHLGGGEQNIIDEVRKRTVAITGAQPVGVTKDITNRPKTRQPKASGGLDKQKTLAAGKTTVHQPITKSKVRPTSGRSHKKRKKETSRRKVERKPAHSELEVAEAVDRHVSMTTGHRASGVNTSGTRAKAHVGIVSRYRYENADGSITWGYNNEDQSFKEETIGIDCITKGRYGYVDPSGQLREYSYSSGVKCNPVTRQQQTVTQSGSSGKRSKHGFFDYNENKFVLPDGRRVTVVVNQSKRARARRV